MLRTVVTSRILAAVAVTASLAGCGGGSTPCPGVEVGGMCWIGRAGVTVTEARAQRVYSIARRFWGESHDPGMWTIEFAIAPVLHVDHEGSGVEVSRAIDGADYFGWACSEHRLIVVHPFAEADCIERSVIFHELGHAWGVEEGDPRLYGEYVLMREAMDASGWRGCLDADGDGGND
jgi:hypothetical protein